MVSYVYVSKSHQKRMFSFFKFSLSFLNPPNLFCFQKLECGLWNMSFSKKPKNNLLIMESLLMQTCFLGGSVASAFTLWISFLSPLLFLAESSHLSWEDLQPSAILYSWGTKDQEARHARAPLLSQSPKVYTTNSGGGAVLLRLLFSTWIPLDTWEKDIELFATC